MIIVKKQDKTVFYDSYIHCRRFLVEDSIKGNLTSVIAETFVFHHRWNHVAFVW